MLKNLNSLERLKKMNRLIEEEKTGNSYQFACKLGMSRSKLYNLIAELKDLGVKISYNQLKKSFVYLDGFKLEIQCSIKINGKEMLMCIGK
ncbi:MAG: hypothetical protein N4A59_00525 [Marinifilum sp.]|jgi:predicted DNA-binding transcriptional regulator YafY|nr:hypothetical protein [Marinifilum sp.]